MSDADKYAHEADEPRPLDDLRRRFLLWIPAAVFGPIALTLLAAAFKFLRPRAGEAAAGADASAGWLAVGRVSELGGEGPVRRAVVVERRAGWSLARREEAVFVLPRGGPRVLSAVCPHEGCEVDWDAGAGAFLCPCHDSRFDAEGARAGGPAERGLAQLPARVSGDVLEVRFGPVSGGGPEAPAVQG
jgi:Rieske Fe-S protein